MGTPVGFMVILALTMLALGATYGSPPIPQTYIVHMDGDKAPSASLSPIEAKTWYENLMTSTMEAFKEEEEGIESHEPEIMYVYRTTMSGFAAKLTAKQAEALPKLEGFLAVYPETLYQLHTTHSPQFLGLQLGQGLWSNTNLSSDVIIAVVDTGVWPEHPSFSSDHKTVAVPERWKGICETGIKFTSANCNSKLVGARAYFKGYEANGAKINDTSEYRSARDSEGHGTHTASTAGGNFIANANVLGNAKGSAAGMRYTARIAVYKVCWGGGCASSDIIAAIDQAVADGVDVISLSLGSGPRPYYSDPIAIGAFGAIRKGVFITCSAGNSGPSESSVSNAAPWLMTVGASYLDRTFPTSIRLGDGRTFKGSSLYSGPPTKSLPLVYADTAGDQGSEYCTDGSLSKKLVTGKIVVCERGMNSRVQKGEQVKINKGAGMLLLNTQEQGEELVADAHVLPASAVGASVAQAIKTYMKTTKQPKAQIVFEGTMYGSVAPIMAAFSSRGPSAVGTDIIKPDITAPGMNILAAWPLSVGPSGLPSDKRRVKFNIISGTSMSCPHVSGLAALLKSVHNDWSPAAIKSALMTTAYTFDNKGKPITDMGKKAQATPFAFGSGHVNPERATNPGLVYDISTDDYLNYLCSLNYSSSQMAIMAGQSYTCPTQKALLPGDLNYPSFSLDFSNGGFNNSSVTYSRVVTNVGTQGSKYEARVVAPEGVVVKVDPLVLAFGKKGEKNSYKVTFMVVSSKTKGASFGELVWVSNGYSVRSPIAVLWG
ncbi:subtilisin-like protease SBT1.1 [Amborella trichopoda]|uniref:Subtilisin-like protease SBT1.1 n=1 Tax=Amborella trichopoda TaxID=13333 RepID=U5DDC5_AMBTC|nr:subtilisin-like protease SBT1.1 [Amborella trichopoda]XP_020531499.1 subtilisin-like protease SBT1.1 [Amborella trichopoda]ERN19432.1 hypothetical protein AMTR_s00069p00175260 [Amborella trichopoda]|eukprot:XP_006857965.1 subtilisin-like protease SBT1.1 [Amborella trichopoda]